MPIKLLHGNAKSFQETDSNRMQPDGTITTTKRPPHAFSAFMDFWDHAPLEFFHYHFEAKPPSSMTRPRYPLPQPSSPRQPTGGLCCGWYSCAVRSLLADRGSGQHLGYCPPCRPGTARRVLLGHQRELLWAQ
eukprot:COSAG01_NODE_277_length_19582_cov_28.126726_6_plen_133_part_00